MTWSVSAQGHHTNEHWEEAERELLARFVDAIEGNEAVNCSSFSFQGNYVRASSLEEARRGGTPTGDSRSKLAPVEEEVVEETPADDGEDDSDEEDEEG